MMEIGQTACERDLKVIRRVGRRKQVDPLVARVAAELRGVFTMLLIIGVLIISPKGLFGREEIH